MRGVAVAQVSTRGARGAGGAQEGGSRRGRRRSSWLMFRMPRRALDVLERDDRYLLKTDAPGVDLDDISVSVRDRLVQVRADSYDGADDREVVYSPSGTSFRAVVKLEAPIDAGRVQVDLVNGILVVFCPKREAGAVRPSRHAPSARRANGQR
jgi:HSP20 family molecular chaperone IbpA